MSLYGDPEDLSTSFTVWLLIGSWKGFPGGSLVKNPPANAGDVRDPGSIPGMGRSSGGGHSNPLQYFCPEIPHGQSSLPGFHPWGCKKLDTTEQLSTAQHTK